MIVTSPSKVERFMEDEEIDAGDEDLSERAEGSCEDRASLLHAICEQKVPNAGCHYTLHHKHAFCINTAAATVTNVSAVCKRRNLTQ